MILALVERLGGGDCVSFQIQLQNKECKSIHERNLQYFKLKKKKVQRQWVGGRGAAGCVHHAQDTKLILGSVSSATTRSL
jgi:hypothetical protein